MNSIEKPRDARAWAKVLAPYGQAKDPRALIELALTVLPFGALWYAMWATLSLGYWLTLLLAIPAAGFLVRLFVLQHDCSHGAFFRRRAANDWTGHIIGVLTLTPHGLWQRTHALHHANAGNLDRRGFGDVETLTVDEYRKRSPLGRLCYRLYRHPLILFGIGPAFVFVVHHRLPIGLMRAGWKPWFSTMATNFAIACVVIALIWMIGLKAFLLIQIPITLAAGSIGVWLFYVQHQFEHAQWDKTGDWNFHNAALYGSTHYDLPVVLRWLTANIGLHHVHHLASRIPCYRLSRVLRDHPELRSVGRLTLIESVRCVRLALWDTAQRRLISFREARLSA